jgi:hypothetical protein
MDARRGPPPKPRSTSRARGALGVLALACGFLLGACREPTEIVVVVDSDLQPGVDFDLIRFVMFNNGSFRSELASATTLPATLGVVPPEFGRQPQFNMTVEVTKGVDVNFNPKTIVSRGISDVRFVPDKQRAVLVEIWRECLCNGTNCPGGPKCSDIIAPVLLDFDEDAIPRLQRP